MPSAAPARVDSVDPALQEVRGLVEDLQAFAFQSERVLQKLDLRAAAQARHVAGQLCTIAPFVQLAIDEELREAAAIKLAELVAQARVCLGRAPRPKSPEQRDDGAEPASSVRVRRDSRREPTLDSEPYRGPTQSESPETASRRGPPTEPNGDATSVDSVDSSPISSGVRLARSIDTVPGTEPDDAAACRQWKSLLAK